MDFAMDLHGMYVDVWIVDTKWFLNPPSVGGGGENRPHSMFSPIKRERIKIETSGFQYLQVEAFATSDQKMEVKVIIGHEI